MKPGEISVTWMWELKIYKLHMEGNGIFHTNSYRNIVQIRNLKILYGYHM